MLLQTQTLPYTAIMKINSGDEFICKVIDETNDHYLVSKPLTIVQTQQGMQFAPILMLADTEKDVYIPKPVIRGTPSPQLENQYQSAISGIALPQSSSIIA